MSVDIPPQEALVLSADSPGEDSRQATPVRRWYHGLTFRQAAITVAVALIFSLLSSAYAIYGEWRKVRDEVTQQKLEVLAQARETAPMLLLSQKNKALEEAVMKALMSHPLIMHAEITRDVNDEQRLQGDDVERMNDAVIRQFQPRQAKFEISEKYGEQLFGGVAVGSTYLSGMKSDKLTQLGQFNLVFSAELMADRFFERVFEEVGLSLAREFLVSLVIVTLFYLFITRPLVRLAASIDRIDPAMPGNWQPPKMPLHSRDEIGDVTARLTTVMDSFQTGLEQRNQARSELTELNADLERRVQQRTHELQRTFDDLDRAHSDLSRANRQMLDSINYAKRIQEAMLSAPDALNGMVKNLMLWWQPLQTVGGDFYSLQRFGDPGVAGDERALIFIADCTGHGVPGAFLTLVVANALEQLTRAARDSSNTQRLQTPSEILCALDKMVRWRLQQSGDAGFDDGFDAGLCLWDAKSRKLQFAGAGIGLMRINDKDHASLGKTMQIKGCRKGLGYSAVHGTAEGTTEARLDVINHQVEVAQGDRFYLFSDGVTDHLGGAKRQLYGRKRLGSLFEKTMNMPLAKQITTLKQELTRYRGGEPIRDDITCIAFEL
jgi:two-component system, sensor histidine kinase SagS